MHVLSEQSNKLAYFSQSLQITKFHCRQVASMLTTFLHLMWIYGISHSDVKLNNITVKNVHCLGWMPVIIDCGTSAPIQGINVTKKSYPHPHERDDHRFIFILGKLFKNDELHDDVINAMEKIKKSSKTMDDFFTSANNFFRTYSVDGVFPMQTRWNENPVTELKIKSDSTTIGARFT